MNDISTLTKYIKISRNHLHPSNKQTNKQTNKQCNWCSNSDGNSHTNYQPWINNQSLKVFYNYILASTCYLRLFCRSKQTGSQVTTVWSLPAGQTRAENVNTSNKAQPNRPDLLALFRTEGQTFTTSGGGKKSPMTWEVEIFPFEGNQRLTDWWV